MSEELNKQAKKMYALEELARLMIANSNDREFDFWKRVQKEIDLITEGLADDERNDKEDNNNP